MKLTILPIIITFCLIGSALAATYSQADNYVGTGFFDAFTFQTIPDPTHGRVNYVDVGTAKAQNLTFAHDDTFILRADSFAVLSPTGPGRNSFRLKSNKQYTTHVAVFDTRHIPQGCGTWPAIWEVDDASWPDHGEVDILEGVNDQGTNQATLHTGAGCSMPPMTAQFGLSQQPDCNVAANGNAGCAVRLSDGGSYGPAFNANGGGWYAMERTNASIKVWFWPRNSGSVPTDVKNTTGSVNTDAWGIPAAFFRSDQCDFAEHFGPHNIIINLTFCGDFAGSAYAASGCPSTCDDFVNNNPGAFNNAFFDIAAVSVYT